MYQIGIGFEEATDKHTKNTTVKYSKCENRLALGCVLIR